MKDTLNCCKLQVTFKREDDLMSGVVYEYTCGWCNSSCYSETKRHLKVRPGNHTGISLLTFKKTKPSKSSSIHDHILQCDNNLSFDEFTILAHRSKKYFLWN